MTSPVLAETQAICDFSQARNNWISTFWCIWLTTFPSCHSPCILAGSKMTTYACNLGNVGIFQQTIEYWIIIRKKGIGVINYFDQRAWCCGVINFSMAQAPVLPTILDTVLLINVDSENHWHLPAVCISEATKSAVLSTGQFASMVTNIDRAFITRLWLWKWWSTLRGWSLWNAITIVVRQTTSRQLRPFRLPYAVYSFMRDCAMPQAAIVLKGRHWHFTHAFRLPIDFWLSSLWLFTVGISNKCNAWLNYDISNVFGMSYSIVFAIPNNTPVVDHPFFVIYGPA